MPVTQRSRKTQGTRITRRVTKRKSSGNGWLYWVGGIAVSLVLTMIFKLSHKSDDDAQVKREMIQVVHDFPDYSEHAAYYDSLVDRCHHAAFEAAYSMGGRRTAAKLDAKVYLVKISSLMAGQASADGKREVSEMLNRFSQAMRSP